ncbi:hypothetical protein GEMRC1_003356 [Eukaryota sp. GEM-RC1]
MSPPPLKQSRHSSSSMSNDSSYINQLTDEDFSGRYWQLLKRRQELPIWSFKDKLLSSVEKNQVTVLVGETGSGKTTQVPQFLLLSPLVGDLGICCTQPRRVAATSVAARVAEELDTVLGDHVGYSIRFDDMTSEKTRLTYLTDGMLLRELMNDPLLSRYKIVIVDEAHERTVATDVLLGILKSLLPQRPDLRVIVMSATLNSEKFTSYFPNAPLLTVPGRLFPVDVKYLDQPERDYLEAAIRTVVQIHQEEGPGDILLFLTGEEEIEQACREISAILTQEPGTGGSCRVLPLYAALPFSAQQRVFEPGPRNGRKVVISTNIAETSITIEGVVYVVDPGFCKQKFYNPRTRIESLPVIPISKASAKQRAGRAGRTQAGKCYRLYTEKAYKEKLIEQTWPEMLRCDITAVVLQMLKLGVKNLVTFDFPDPPAPETMMRALELLSFLGAINDEVQLTDLGAKLAELPLDPQLSKMIILACDPQFNLNCGNEAITIASLLSVPPLLLRPSDRRKEADEAHQEFFKYDSDHLALLNVYLEYMRNYDVSDWAVTRFVSKRSLQQAERIRNQLEKLCQKLDLPLASVDFNSSDWVDKIKKSIVGGFFSQAAHMFKKGKYLTIKDNQEVSIHPSSCLNSLSSAPSWVLFNEFVKTSQNFIRTVTAIDGRWLLELAPEYYDLDDEHFPECPAKTDLKIKKKFLEKLKKRH